MADRSYTAQKAIHEIREITQKVLNSTLEARPILYRSDYAVHGD